MPLSVSTAWYGIWIGRGLPGGISSNQLSSVATRKTPKAGRVEKPTPTQAMDFKRKGRSQSKAEELDALLVRRASSYESFDSEDKTLATAKGEVDVPDEDENANGFSWKTLWAYAGPGWLMSIAYVDPGNLESDLQAGAYGGYQLIWVLLMSTIMGLFLQVLAARLGVVTGRNLAEMCTMIYPRWASLILWVMAEIAIIGSDIQEVLGSAIALNILLSFPLWLGCLVTGLDSFAFLFLHRYGIRKLELFFVVLILLMLVCFLLNFTVGGIDLPKLSTGFVPTITRDIHTQAVGLIGAVIMPHNIFLHSALVQTRRVDPQNLRKVKEANKYFAIEASGALAVSFLINLAVMGVFSKGFYSSDCIASFNVDGSNTACIPAGVDVGGSSYGTCTLENGMQGVCHAIGLEKAGEALKSLLGKYAKYIWAVGLLAAGQSSTMTGTYAGQFVMEGFLNLRLAPWKRAAFTRGVALVPAMVVSILAERNPEEMDHIGELLNVLQSIQLPFALLPVLVFTSSGHLMGKFTNSLGMVVFGWLMGFVVCSTNLFLVSSKLSGMELSGHTAFSLVLLGVLYFVFLGYLIKTDVLIFWYWLMAKWTGEESGSEADSDDASQRSREDEQKPKEETNVQLMSV